VRLRVADGEVDVNRLPIHAPHPGGPPPIFLEIDRAMRANDMPRAIELAGEALDAGHADPVLFNLRAYGNKNGGRLEEALADLQRAIAMAPGSAKALSEAADCLNRLGRNGEALAASTAAVAIDPLLAYAWFQKAFAHHMLNELDPAWTDYHRAIALNPQMADAFARLAALAISRGEVRDARLYADKALALRTGDPVTTLAHVDVDLAEGHLDEAEHRLLALLSDPKAVAPVQESAIASLADLRDAQGRTAEAFAAYREAGTVWKASHRDRLERPGLDSVPDRLRAMTAAIEGLPPGRWGAPEQFARAASDDSASLAFILGFPRSGTTLLAQILASQPNVAVLEEKPLLTQAIVDFAEAKDGFAKLAALPRSEVERYREDFWRRVRRSGVDTRGKLVLEQTAFNTAYLPLIRKLFPEAKIVFALRDPRDVVFSCFRRMFAPNLFTREFHALETAARLYDITMRFARACRNRLDVTTHDIRNEDLIADFDGETRRLCAHVGLAWSESIRDYHTVTAQRMLGTVSATQVRRGINTDGVGQWRRYRDELAPVMPLLMPWVEKFGYPAE
jgi:tetratricopeptide (TPR) repeat protein